MKIIALRGKENSGKSHVLNIVYQLLLIDNWSQVPGNFRELGNSTFNDVIDVLKKDGTLLGIVSAGDYQIGEIGLKNLLMELEKKNCDICLCACRTNPKIENAVTNYQNHIWIDKTISTGKENDRIVNNIDANRIINILS